MRRHSGRALIGPVPSWYRRSAVLAVLFLLIGVPPGSAVADEWGYHCPGSLANSGGTAFRASYHCVAGDFNGDGRDDLARFRTREALEWFLVSDWLVYISADGRFERDWFAVFDIDGLYGPAVGWQSHGPHLVGDFNGDGLDDVADFVGEGARWFVSVSTGTSFTTALWADFESVRWARHLVGDFDGDGLDDIANYHETTGRWYVSRSTGSSFSTTRWADFYTRDGWTVQSVGDFNGDGLDDIANYHVRTGRVYVSISTGDSFRTVRWAQTSVPRVWGPQLVGDFNGDGRSDVASWRAGLGQWSVWISTGSSFSPHELWAGFVTRDGWDPQIVGDFTGDGQDDIANFHTRTARWYVSRSTGTRFDTRRWDEFDSPAGWEPQLPGDFNGDGRTDVANLHEPTDEWFISVSQGRDFLTAIWPY